MGRTKIDLTPGPLVPNSHSFFTWKLENHIVLTLEMNLYYCPVVVSNQLSTSLLCWVLVFWSFVSCDLNSHGIHVIHTLILNNHTLHLSRPGHTPCYTWQPSTVQSTWPVLFRFLLLLLLLLSFTVLFLLNLSFSSSACLYFVHVLGNRFEFIFAKSLLCCFWLIIQEKDRIFMSFSLMFD